MLMFQNSLLATFIPEILMVIGYVLCLITPGFKTHNSVVEQPSIVVHIASHELQQHSLYKLSGAYFHTDTELIDDTKQFLPPVVEKDTFLSFESPFFTSDSLSYVNFSRPPPGFNA